MADAVGSTGIAPKPTTDTVAARSLYRPGKRQALGVLLVTLAVLSIPNIVGFAYFVSPIQQRVRSPLHDWLKPTGYVGQSLGILALAMFLFLWLYPLRKRIPLLRNVGSLPRWLDVHILVGLTVPLVGATHAAWQFRGLIGLGYLAMLTVAVSGIFGKYLYARIPRAADGAELTRAELIARHNELSTWIAARSPLPNERAREILERSMLDQLEPKRSLAGRLLLLAHSEWTRQATARRMAHDLRLTCAGRELEQILRIVRRQIAIDQQIQALTATRRVFQYWHIAHMPIAITALIAVGLHVVVAIALGVTWF